ncbi:MAG: hypothetical protein ACREID_09395 [Planctomycetota bacterium]
MRALFWAALALGFALRLQAALAAGGLRPDEKHRYLPIARSLRDGGGFAIAGRPTAQCMPLWPMVLAAWPEAFEPRLLNALLSTACLPMAWLVARRLGGTRVAAAVLVALAVDLDHRPLAGSVLIEPLFTLLLLAFSRAWLERRTLAAAGLCGLCALARPEAFLFPLALAAWTREWRRPAALLCGVVLALAPWVARNALVWGAFVPFTTTRGITLVSAMNPGEEKLPFRSRGQGRAPEWREGLPLPAERGEVRNDRELSRRAERYALDHPGSALKITLAKAVLLWTPFQRKGASAVYAIAVVLAWWGIFRRVRLSAPLVAPLLCVMTFVGLAFLAIPRYRAPYHFAMYVVAAASVLSGKART